MNLEPIMGLLTSCVFENEFLNILPTVVFDIDLPVRPFEFEGEVVVGETVPEAHIVYCRSQMLLDRQQYSSWRDIQDAYDDYVASLGPWSETDIVGFFADDCGADDLQWPFTRQAVADFFRSDDLLLMCPDAELSPIADGEGM
jgi:hypothetical protein